LARLFHVKPRVARMRTLLRHTLRSEIAGAADCPRAMEALMEAADRARPLQRHRPWLSKRDVVRISSKPRQFVTDRDACDGHGMQEVGGSSPPSSTSRNARETGRFRFFPSCATLLLRPHGPGGDTADERIDGVAPAIPRGAPRRAAGATASRPATGSATSRCDPGPEDAGGRGA
jgi:hypothetical protein